MHPIITCCQPQANWQTVAQHLVCKMVIHHTYLVHLFAGHQVPTSMGVRFMCTSKSWKQTDPLEFVVFSYIALVVHKFWPSCPSGIWCSIPISRLVRFNSTIEIHYLISST